MKLLGDRALGLGRRRAEHCGNNLSPSEINAHYKQSQYEQLELLEFQYLFLWISYGIKFKNPPSIRWIILLHLQYGL